MTSHTPAETRRERFARRYPRLYALRHVAKGTGKAAAALIGIGLLLQLLPAIPWPDIPLPSIDLPEIPWPDIPLPSIDLPEITVPAWLRAILEAKKYWLPILIGIVARRARDEAATAARTGRVKAVSCRTAATVGERTRPLDRLTG
jgi:hypothetical protein